MSFSQARGAPFGAQGGPQTGTQVGAPFPGSPHPGSPYPGAPGVPSATGRPGMPGNHESHAWPTFRTADYWNTMSQPNQPDFSQGLNFGNSIFGGGQFPDQHRGPPPQAYSPQVPQDYTQQPQRWMQASPYFNVSQSPGAPQNPFFNMQGSMNFGQPGGYPANLVPMPTVPRGYSGGYPR